MTVARRWMGQLAAVAALVVAADQATKWRVQQAFRLGEKLTLVPDILYLTYVRNPGVAFGMLGEVSWSWRLPFFLLTAVAAAWLLWKLFHEAGGLVLGRLSLGMILGGALGNLVDRLRWGEVVDFIDCWYRGWHWPTFNVADSCITVGTGVLLWTLHRAGRG